MAEDRFANVFTAEATQGGANALVFTELTFGITLRDRIAIVIDELYFYASRTAIQEMTAVGDQLQWALVVSDQVTDLNDLGDRRILYATFVQRADFGTAAGAAHIRIPIKESFAPPLISLPNRLYFAANSEGLATAAIFRLRMHFRTVSITQDQQLIEVLEAFQLST